MRVIGDRRESGGRAVGGREEFDIAETKGEEISASWCFWALYDWR